MYYIYCIYIIYIYIIYIYIYIYIYMYIYSQPANLTDRVLKPPSLPITKRHWD